MARSILLTIVLPAFLVSIASAAPAKQTAPNPAFAGPGDNWDAPHVVHPNGFEFEEDNLDDIPPLPVLTRQNGFREDSDDSPVAPHNSEDEEIPAELPRLTRQNGFREDSEDELPELPKLVRQNGVREDSDDELPEIPQLRRQNGMREDSDNESPELPQLRRQNGKVWSKKD